MWESIFRPYRSSDAEHSDRSAGDRMRHREKVRQSIRENIADIIAEESIIGRDRGRIIKVPIRESRNIVLYTGTTPAAWPGSGGRLAGRRD